MKLLKQGYLLTRKNGKVVRSGKGLQKGDIIDKIHTAKLRVLYKNKKEVNHMEKRIDYLSWTNILWELHFCQHLEAKIHHVEHAL